MKSVLVMERVLKEVTMLVKNDYTHELNDFIDTVFEL